MLLNSLSFDSRAQVTELENEIRSIQESKKAELSALNKKISELRFVINDVYSAYSK